MAGQLSRPGVEFLVPTIDHLDGFNWLIVLFEVNPAFCWALLGLVSYGFVWGYCICCSLSQPSMTLLGHCCFRCGAMSLDKGSFSLAVWIWLLVLV